MDEEGRRALVLEGVQIELPQVTGGQLELNEAVDRERAYWYHLLVTNYPKLDAPELTQALIHLAAVAIKMATQHILPPG